jgi:hypothetical protein
MKIILGFVVMALFALPGRAQTFTPDGNYLLGACQITIRVADDPKTHLDIYEAWRDGYCRGIIEGVTSASPLVCPTGGVTFGQEVRVVLKFLQDHPEKLHLSGAQLVQDALAQAFPCSK